GARERAVAGGARAARGGGRGRGGAAGGQPAGLHLRRRRGGGAGGGRPPPATSRLPRTLSSRTCQRFASWFTTRPGQPPPIRKAPSASCLKEIFRSKQPSTGASDPGADLVRSIWSGRVWSG